MSASTNRTNCVGLAVKRVAQVILAVGAAIASGMALAQSIAAGYQPAEWAKIVAAAKKEGKVTLYSAPPQTARLAEGFKKAQPDIVIEATRGPSGQLQTKLDQERDTGLDGADAAILSESGWFIEQGKAGRLLKAQGPGAVGWPARYLREGVVIPGVEPFVIPYNKQLVATPPKGYADMFKPEYQGKIALSELSATVLVAFYDWLEKTQGSNYLSRAQAMKPRIYVGAVPIGQALASGEIATSIHGVPSALRALIDKGAPIDYVVPNPAFGFEYAMGALGWSKRPNAALVLLDYFMSEAGQTGWHGLGESASPRSGIKGSLNAASINPYNPADYPPEKSNAFRVHWNGIFK